MGKKRHIRIKYSVNCKCVAHLQSLWKILQHLEKVSVSSFPCYHLLEGPRRIQNKCRAAAESPLCLVSSCHFAPLCGLRPKGSWKDRSVWDMREERGVKGTFLSWNLFRHKYFNVGETRCFIGLHWFAKEITLGIATLEVLWVMRL